MRAVNGLMCILLIAFTAVQYNDPDALVWMLVYAIPALWAGIACWRPALLRRAPAHALLAACLLAAVAATFALWPDEARFWTREVWWNSELAREGMGMMIVTFALVLVAITARGRSRRAGPP